MLSRPEIIKSLRILEEEREVLKDSSNYAKNEFYILTGWIEGLRYVLQRNTRLLSNVKR
jgi:hypothetical protein